eukprot:gene14808-biopygen14878
MAFSDRIDTVGEASCERKATAGVFKVTTRVCGSLALAVLIRLNGSLHSDALLSRMRNRLKAASSAVIGEPSENFAARSLKVYVRPSLEMSQLSASPGSILVPRLSTRTRVS